MRSLAFFFLMSFVIEIACAPGCCCWSRLWDVLVFLRVEIGMDVRCEVRSWKHSCSCENWKQLKVKSLWGNILLFSLRRGSGFRGPCACTVWSGCTATSVAINQWQSLPSSATPPMSLKSEWWRMTLKQGLVRWVNVPLKNHFAFM